ncbi:hypothetical protein HK097_002084 [Rhizophlyctis rosea]|uniref:Uncharacterized protein n=1 Tax=Rhizophlyctis rosea TaxID=64517 RepID=A0AAD5S5S8_9FUNG|nr:hypothetical protein HK097_002084 [Rhizophlyctis rosea]
MFNKTRPTSTQSTASEMLPAYTELPVAPQQTYPTIPTRKYGASLCPRTRSPQPPIYENVPSLQTGLTIKQAKSILKAF